MFQAHFSRYIIIVAILVGLCTAWYYWNNPLTTKLRIGDAEITVELAMTDDEIVKGLGYRDTMPDRHGMLFVFKSIGKYSFWMKGMRFPLDLIWIRDDTVVDITRNVPVVSQGEEYPRYESGKMVNRVLEINAGESDALGIKVGDRVEYITP